MAYKNLSDFIEALEAQGELVRVRREVSPVLEIAEIADRAVKGEGPALLFENVSGSTMPVAINLFASRRRMLAALQISSYEEWNERLEFFLDPKPPEGLIEKLKAIPKVTELTAVFPKTVRSAPCQEVVETGDSVDLASLPVLTCWPQDGGPFITMPLVVTRDPASGEEKPCLSLPPRPWISWFRPRPRSCSRDTSSRGRGGGRDPSGITPGSTRSTTTFPSSTSRPRRAAGLRSI